MKTKLLLFLYAAIIPFFAFSQKNEASLGMLFCPTGGGDKVIFLNPGFYKTISGKSSLGFEIDYGQYFEKVDNYYKNLEGRKDLYFGINALYKYNIFEKRKHSISSGFGAFGGASVIYYKTIPRILVCGTGLPENWTPPKPPNHWNFEYITGIVATLDYKYNIFNNIYLGITIRGKISYYFEYDEVIANGLPLLKVGYIW